MTQAFNLAQLANNLDSSGRLDATDGLVNAVPVTNGGTGASTVAAAVSNLSASIYPVGSIYINAGVTTNPATLLGFGTWTAFGAGRVLVGLNAGDSAFDTLQETGGSKDATVVSHTHGVNITTASAGSHNHGYTGVQGTGYPDGANDSIAEGNVLSYVRETQVLNAGTHTHSVTGTTDSTGASGSNANLQPYITVCMWLRTA
jgi:hypothetical protein